MSVERDSLPAPVYAISAFSLICNVVLLYIYITCPLKKIKSYKYFFLLYVIQGVLYSTTFALDLPRVIAQDSFVIIICAGVVSQKPLSVVLHLTYCMTFFASVVLVTNSFVYRYLQVCRPSLFGQLSTKKTLLMGVFVNFLIFTNIFTVLYNALWPDENFIKFVNTTVRIPGVGISDATFFGFSVEYGMDVLHITMITEIVFLLVSICSLNVYCANKIKAFLKNASKSNNFLMLQRQMFAQLLVQSFNQYRQSTLEIGPGLPIYLRQISVPCPTATYKNDVLNSHIFQACCPLLFLVTPFTFATSLPFIGIDSNNLITNTITIVFAMYPIFNPIIIIMFVNEYRTFILINLKLKKPAGHATESMFIGSHKIAYKRRVSSVHI
ncbi:hypothetical protein GCK32_004767 [Trichostrongylus colubriformis]|uniref:Uncharacterized protein n=1 Tax=Trichostrongylus colubriformis TaxID=6319 RepID=A0AAN8IXK6_TRICO